MVTFAHRRSGAFAVDEQSVGADREVARDRVHPEVQTGARRRAPVPMPATSSSKLRSPGASPAVAPRPRAKTARGLRTVDALPERRP